MLRQWITVSIVIAFAGCDKTSNTSPVARTGGSANKAAADQNEARQISGPLPFEAIALATDTSHSASPIREGEHPGQVCELTALKLKFCWCPAGTFLMGSKEDSAGHLNNEKPFTATLSKGFWIQQTELTQDQYEQLMGTNPSEFREAENPVESVTWIEAAEFCRRISALLPEKEAGNIYRLPTEAEWEYACRAGTTTQFSFGDDEKQLDDFGWYAKNSKRTTHPVGQKQPNPWGLFDVHGNVSEWCSDTYVDYPGGDTIDPQGPALGEKRNLRGGDWFHVPMYARSAHRDANIPEARYVGRGFRLVALVSQPSDPTKGTPTEDKQ